MKMPPFVPRVLIGTCLGVSVLACGGEKPRARSAATVSTSSEPLTSGSLSDSTLGPAARQAAQTEDWPQAEKLYREFSRRQPRSAEAKRGLGVALMRQGKNVPAVTALTESMELADDADTRLALAENYGEMDRYPSALPHVRRAVAMSQGSPLAWAQLAETLLKVEKADDAADALNNALHVCKACSQHVRWIHVRDEVAVALTARAEKQVRSGSAADARKTLTTAAALNPDLPEAHLSLGKLAKIEGDENRAATEFRKALDKLPDAKVDAGAVARLELARLLTNRGDGGEAAKLAQQVVDARGGDIASLDVLGRACEANKDVDCARNAYGRLVTLPLGEASGSPDAAGAKSDVKKVCEHARVRLKALKSDKPRRKHKAKQS